MTLISQKDNQPVAAIYNNILLLADGTVLGVILGHCVFGRHGKVVAKYFQQHLYTLDGRILARDHSSAVRPPTDIHLLLEKAWILIGRIKDHTCLQIEPTEKWAQVPLTEYFV